MYRKEVTEVEIGQKSSESTVMRLLVEYVQWAAPVRDTGEAAPETM